MKTLFLAGLAALALLCVCAMDRADEEHGSTARPLASRSARGRRPEKKKEASKMDPSKITAVDISPSSWKGAHSSVNQAAGFTVETDADWGKLWKDYLNQDAPPLDFTQYFAAAVFAGLRPTGGWGVEFLPPVSDGKTAVIFYRIKGPGKSSFVTQAFTTPYAIRLYRKTGLSVKVEEQKP